MKSSEYADLLEKTAALLRQYPFNEDIATLPPASKYTPDFLEAIRVVLLDEGGYGNDPNDPGGETNWGIDKRTYPDLDIKNLTRDEAIEIYYNDWWQKYRLDLLPNKVRGKIFNVGVNTGMRQAVKFLQRAVNVNDDGIIGPVTLAAANEADPDIVLQSLRDQQRQFYINLANARPSSRKFLNGWLRRAAE